MYIKAEDSVPKMPRLDSSILQLVVCFRGNKFTLGAKRTESVATLKQKIQHAQGVSANNQKLILFGEEKQSAFVNEKTLSEYELTNGTTLLLELHLVQI